MSKHASSKFFKAISDLMDQLWLETLIKSVKQPVVGGIELPGFPSEEVQTNITGSSGEHTLREAFNFYCKVKYYALNLGVGLGHNTGILDFGCGWGRIIRFFLKDVFADHLYGIDVDPNMIEICQKVVKYGNYSLCNPLPPTDFSDNRFEIILAYSVFSHLAEPVHIKWLEEFSRILKPGGVLLATTRPRSFIECCRSLRGKKHDFEYFNVLASSFLDTESALAEYDNGNFLYSATGGGVVHPSSFYGEAVIPKAYVEREWIKYLEFRDFVDDPSLSYQAIVVMQKPFGNLQNHAGSFERRGQTEGNRINELETHLRDLEATLIQESSYIRSIECLLKEREATLNNIYKSRGWKALIDYYKLRDKMLWWKHKL